MGRRLRKPVAAGDLQPVYFYPDDLKGHIERVYKPGE
jgi:acyl-homoserine-lactone acylase